MLIGEASNDYDVIQKKEQLTQVETRLYQLLAQVKQINNEQVRWRSHWRAWSTCYPFAPIRFCSAHRCFHMPRSPLAIHVRCWLIMPSAVVQAYQRTREATFREISESTNVRVLWWSIAQGAVLVITGYLQLRHLKGFFEAKKLV